MIVVRSASRGSTLTLPAGEPVAVGKFVAVNSSGQGITADSTVNGRFPAVGVCVFSSASVVRVQPSGGADVFSGLTSGVVYYLGTGGAAVLVPPAGAKIAQRVLHAVSSDEAVVTAGATPVFI